MSLMEARIHLSKVTWKTFFQMKERTLKRGAYKFKAHIGMRYGRMSVWITNHGKDVHLQFLKGEGDFPWKNWELYGGWMTPDRFKKLTGIDASSTVVKRVED